MTKVAALYIATGRYTVFWPEFYESAEKYLLKDCEVHYFVFTDAATLPGDDNPRVHICAQEAYSWPFATLRRFEIFLKQEQALKAFDYIFFFNANAEFMQPAQEEGSAFVAWIGDELDDFLCEQYERVVGKDNCVAFEGLKLQIPPDRYRMHYVKVKVRVHRYLDGRLAIFHGPRRLARYTADGQLQTPELQVVA